MTQRRKVPDKEYRCLTIRSVHPDLHKDLRTVAAVKGRELTDIYNEAFEHYVAGFNLPTE